MCYFEVYVHDDRYSVPTLHLPETGEKSAVVQWTVRYLGESHHHVWAEIWRDNACVARLGTVREPTSPGP